MSEEDPCDIYIGDLPKTVDQKFLMEFVHEISVAESITLKDARFEDAKYAFLRIKSRKDAVKIIEDLNYTKLDGRPIRISLADPITRRLIKIGEANLVIKRLDVSIEVQQLHEAFSNFGEIISCRIPLTENQSRGYGYVQFRNKEDSERARMDLGEANFNNKKIEISVYVKRPHVNLEDTYSNIYVKDLPPTIDTVENFQALVQGFGEIQHISLCFKEDLPYGFCNFRFHGDAVTAVKTLNGSEIEGKVIYAGRAQTRRERTMNLRDNFEKMKRLKYNETRKRNLYVRGFDATMQEDNLIDILGKYGEIESVAIIREKVHPFESKKFGFVCFKNEADALKCVSMSAAENLKTPENRVIFMGFAQRKEDREKHLTAIYQQKSPVPNPGGKPISADKFENNAALPPDLFPSLRNFRAELVNRISEQCSQPDGLSLIDKLKKISNDQIKAIVLNSDIWDQWKERAILE